MKRSVKDDFCCEPIKPDQETLLASDLGSLSKRTLLKGFLARNSTAAAFPQVLVERRPLCVNVWVNSGKTDSNAFLCCCKMPLLETL